jgi:galactonate dehydratase
LRIVGPSLVVKVWAGDTYGLGECYPSGPVRGIHDIVEGLADQLVGEDPRDVERIVEKLRRWHLFTGAQGGAVMTAISGIEIALWDLAGKLQGVPVFRLLGGAFRTRLALYADCHAGSVDAAGHHTQNGRSGLGERGAIERLLDMIRMAVEAGFSAVKIDVDDVYGPDTHDAWNRTLTRRQVDRMAGQVAAVREAIGPHIDLAVDMHGRYDIQSAVRAADALAEFDLMWLEEPVPPENIEAMAEVRSRTTVPIAGGENLYTRYQFEPYLRLGAADTVTPDLAKFGGLAEGKRVANLAELHYVAFSPHNVSGPIGTLAAAHVCAAVSNFTYLEYHALDLDFWEGIVHHQAGPLLVDGHIELSEAPGLGVELNEDVARAHEHARAGVPFLGDVA